MVPNKFYIILSSGVKILKYAELEKFTDINQVIPDDRGYRIILNVRRGIEPAYYDITVILLNGLIHIR